MYTSLVKLEPLGESGTWKNVPMNRDLSRKPVKSRSSNSRVVIAVEVHETVSLYTECCLREYTLDIGTRVGDQGKWVGGVALCHPPEFRLSG